MVYEYTKLKGPFQLNSKYNVYGVVKHIKKKTSEINGKLTTKFSILDETIVEPFYVTIFCRTADEVIPEITEGSIIRLHRMVVENFNNSFDGRVFSSNDLAIIPKALLASLDWISSAKKLSITDLDNNRAVELITWMETVADLPKFVDDIFPNEVRGDTVKPSCSSEAKLDNSAQTEVSYFQYIKKTASAYSSNNDEESRKCHNDEVLDFEPSVADLSQADFKDLLVWRCKCGSQFRTSQLLWSPGPKRKKHLGSTKCRHCDSIGFTVPRFHFYVKRSVGVEGAERQPFRSLICGEEACDLLGTNIPSYAFDDSESNLCNSQLIAIIQTMLT